MEIHVCFCVDQKYLEPISVVIRSIIANSEDPAALRFHVFFDGDEQEAGARIAAWQLPRVELERVHGAFAESSRMGHLSMATLLRTQLPLFLPNVERAIYLDSDVVVSRDLGELYGANLQGAAIGGVADIFLYKRMRRGLAKGDPQDRDYFLSLGLDPTRPQYINAGVMIMDLEKLRELNFSETAVQLWKERGEDFAFLDQCLINFALRDHIALLDPRWNVQATLLENRRHYHYVPGMLQGALRLQQGEQWITHFVGREKPWDGAEVWNGELWWKYADGSLRERGRPPAWPRPLGQKMKDGILDVRSWLSAASLRLSELMHGDKL